MNVALQIGFLTGQSDPRRCGLSPEQSAFLSGVADGYDVRQIPLTFPYAGDATYQEVSLLPASLANGAQFLAASLAPCRWDVRQRLEDLVGSAHHTIFLCGSAGLQLFRSARLPRRLAARCTVIAYGPVGWMRPAAWRLILVRGKRDWVSRPWFSRVQHVVAGGHRDYLRSSEFAAVVRRAIAQELSSSLCTSTL